MFRFMKDAWLAGHGVDIEAVKARRSEEAEVKRLERYIFGVRSKVAISILAALYVSLNIWSMVSGGSFGVNTAFDILLCTIAAGTGVSIWLGKKGEVAALIGIISLAAGIYIKTVL